LDRTGLINSIVEAVEAIARGRLGFAGRGPEGRVYYEEGLSIALAAFKEADTGADPRTIALAEEAFLRQELFFCDERDTNAHGSLTTALQSFDDAFLCLEAVEETGYAAAEKTYPHNPKYRTQNFPKDAFHIACTAHYTRLHNVLRSPGIDMLEKTVLEQRAANVKTALKSYLEKQKKALSPKRAE
jgi:hypothetical protein